MFKNNRIIHTIRFSLKLNEIHLNNVCFVKIGQFVIKFYRDISKWLYEQSHIIGRFFFKILAEMTHHESFRGLLCYKTSGNYNIFDVDNHDFIDEYYEFVQNF